MIERIIRYESKIALTDNELQISESTYFVFTNDTYRALIEKSNKFPKYGNDIKSDRQLISAGNVGSNDEQHFILLLSARTSDWTQAQLLDLSRVIRFYRQST